MTKIKTWLDISEKMHFLSVKPFLYKHFASIYFRLEVSLSKKDRTMWSLVVRGNMRGEMVASEEQLAEIHNRLSHLTSEQWVSTVFLFIL